MASISGQFWVATETPRLSRYGRDGLTQRFDLYRFRMSFKGNTHLYGCLCRLLVPVWLGYVVGSVMRRNVTGGPELMAQMIDALPHTSRCGVYMADLV